MANFDKIIVRTLVHEGGLSNDKADAGGLTKYGISQRAYPDEDIATLTKERAKQLYRRDYWMPIQGDGLLYDQTAYLIFDMAVNSGVRTAVKMAQRVVGVTADASIGPKTLAALNKKNPSEFALGYVKERQTYYRGIVNCKPDQARFLAGWLKRAGDQGTDFA